jgi:hypothetical protein
MEAAFMFFALDGPFGWTDKREKRRESIHKKLSHKIDEKWWQQQIWFNFDKIPTMKNVKSQVNVCFCAVKRECFRLQFDFFLTSDWKQTPMLFKGIDENTPFLTDVTKYPVCFWNMKAEH